MRVGVLLTALFVSGLISVAGSAQASSYLTRGGFVVDPIQSAVGGPHPYSGPNLEPFVSASGAILDSAVLSFADLFVADLRFANLTGAQLDNANLDFALLIDAHLRNADVAEAFLRNANLRGATLINARFIFCALEGANFSDADLTDALFFGSNAVGALFLNADLLNADLRGTDFTNANLEGADLSGAAYDEVTRFPSGFSYAVSPWDIDADQTTPWDAGMRPVPEPSIGWLSLAGASALAAFGRPRRR